MKDNFKKIPAYIVIALLMLYVFGSGVWDIVNVNARRRVTVAEAVPLISIEHSISGIIPMGTDYYYIALEENTMDAYVIQASKHWLEKSFTDGQPVTVTGLSKSYSDFNVRREIAARLSGIEGVVYPLGVDRYLSLSYIGNACLKIFGILTLAAVIGFYIYFKKPEREAGPWQKKLLLALMCASLAAILFAIL